MTLSDWKTQAITIEFMAELNRRVAEQKEQLASSAGMDSRLDSYRSGIIAALCDVMDFHFDEELLEND